MKGVMLVTVAMTIMLLSISSFAEQKSGSGSQTQAPKSTQSSTIQSSGAPASAIAICGIKPPPPVGFWPDDAVCLCDGKKCKWVWMKR